MSTEEQPPRAVRERLTAEVSAAVEAAASASEASAEGGERSAAPGHVYAFAATAEYDVEWLLSGADPARPGHRRAVAIDTGPWVGGADLELPPEAGLGPLVAHCRHWLWLSGEDLATGARTGRVTAATAADVEEHCRRVEDDRLEPSPLERETDADPDYRDREGELATARVALLETRRTATSRPRKAAITSVPRLLPGSGAPRLNRWWWAAAAALLLALVAIGLLAVEQHRELAELRHQVAAMRAPSVVKLGEFFQVGTTYRGADPLSPVESGGRLQIPLVWPDPPPSFEVEIAPPEGGEALVRFQDLALEPGEGEYLLSWSTDLLAPGDYLIRVLDPNQEPPRVIDTERLRIGHHTDGYIPDAGIGLDGI